MITYPNAPHAMTNEFRLNYVPFIFFLPTDAMKIIWQNYQGRAVCDASSDKIIDNDTLNRIFYAKNNEEKQQIYNDLLMYDALLHHDEYTYFLFDVVKIRFKELENAETMEENEMRVLWSQYLMLK